MFLKLSKGQEQEKKYRKVLSNSELNMLKKVNNEERKQSLVKKYIAFHLHILRKNKFIEIFNIGRIASYIISSPVLF